MKVWSVAILTVFSLYITSFSPDIIIEPISITTHDGIEISGAIELPAKGNLLPSVILAWGNGPHTRDQEISGTPMFKLISDALVNNGIAVMRIDKRGFGSSSVKYDNSEETYTTLDLKKDIELGLQLLKDHSRTDKDKVGIIGHSEGAIIATMLNAEAKLAWSILMAPPAVSGKEIFLEQRRLNRVRLGMDETISDAVGMAFAQYVDFIKSDFTNDEVHYEKGKAFLLAHGMTEDDDLFGKELVDQVLDGFRNQWYKYFFNQDMNHLLSSIKSPTLAIYGAKDNQVTTRQNMNPCLLALKKSGIPYQVTVLSECDHFFLTFEGNYVEKHVFGQMEIASDLIPIMMGFLESNDVL